jgi:hypothetical protein
MIYRYRLKDCNENSGLSSRQIEGITLYKKRWLYRDKPIVFDSYLNLIDFQKAESEQEFEEREKVAQQKIIDEKRRVVRERIREPKKEETKIIPQLKELSLKEQCIEHGFTEAEIYGLDDKALRKLLKLENDIK